MKVKLDNQNFESFAKSPYYVDNTDAIAYAFTQDERHVVITRPRRWGKTLFLQSLQLFCGLELDPIEGNIIDINNTDESPFGVFTHLKVVVQDTIEIDDILFILQSHQKEKSIKYQFKYFKEACYPEFLSHLINKEDQKTILAKKLKVALTCFLPEISEEYSSFCKHNHDQQKLILEESIKKMKTDNIQAYYQLLKEFGQTCRHYQRYPIIFITFPIGIRKIMSSTEAATEFTENMISSIMDLYFNNDHIFNQMKHNKNRFLGELELSEGFLKGKIDLKYSSKSLRNLAIVFNKLYKMNSIILIDEYDSVLISAEVCGCLQDIAGRIIQPMFAAALKNNKEVFRSFTVGITRVAKADLFSGVNHLQECTLLDTYYEQCFGFSEIQVKKLLQQCNLKMPAKQQIKRSMLKMMYNSYKIGKGSYYNPFSIYKCVSESLEKKCPTYDSFWADSGSILYLADIFTRTDDFEKNIETFLNKELVFKPNQHLDFSCLRLKSGITLQTAFSFAFHLGYLTLSQNQNQNSSTKTEKDNRELRFKIPNKEIRDYILTKFLPLYYSIKWNIAELNFEGLLKFHNQIDQMEQYEEKVKSIFLNGLDFQQSLTESDFQAFFYQSYNLVELNYKSLNEQQTASGKRLDTIFYPKNQSSPIIILHEYKVSKDGNYQKSLDNALWQIFSKCYVENTLPKNTKLTNTTHVIIRALVFFKNQEISKWEMKAEQFKLTIKQIRKLIATCAVYNNFAKEKSNLSENEIKKEFLIQHNFSSISSLISSHSLQKPTKTSFSSSAQIKAILPVMRAEFAVPQPKFYRIDFLHSLKAIQYPPPPQKMTTSLLSDFQRAEKGRLQVEFIEKTSFLRRTLSFFKKIL